MPNTVTCFECGKDVLETAPGPYGFVQVCRTCGATANLNDLMEPLGDENPARRLTPQAA